MTKNKDARELGYNDCLNREAAFKWIESASIEALHDSLHSFADFERSWMMPDVNFLRVLLVAEGTVFSPFVDSNCLSVRLENVDEFRLGELRWINMRTLFPEFYELWNFIHDAVAARSDTVWEKAHSWMTRDFNDPLGPGDLDALTYAGRHSSEGPDSAKIQAILFEWATRIIRRNTPPDDAANRAASGEMSIAEVQSLWEERHVGPYYIWSPRHGERLVCDGIIQRLAYTFDISNFEYWTNATTDEFLTGPVSGMDQIDGALWLFWTLFGPHDLISKAPASTLATWGWNL